MRRPAFAVLQLTLTSSLAAQSPVNRESPKAVTEQFVRIADLFGSRLVSAFDSIPETRYDYRPTVKQQTVGYIAQHLENANYSLCERLGSARRAATAKDSLPDTLKARWPKDTLVARLTESLRFCDRALEHVDELNSAELANSLLLFETDLAEHYSQISVYMRLLGLVPPSALSPRKRTPIDLPASELARYVGVYTITEGWGLVVTMQDERLYVKSNPGGATVRLWPESRADFFVNEVDAQITFERGPDGAVSGLVVHQSGRDRRARKIP
jgi:uncharacterized protein DUF3471